jgi:hypothetical protein
VKPRLGTLSLPLKPGLKRNNRISRGRSQHKLVPSHPTPRHKVSLDHIQIHGPNDQEGNRNGAVPLIIWTERRASAPASHGRPSLTLRKTHKASAQEWFSHIFLRTWTGLCQRLLPSLTHSYFQSFYLALSLTIFCIFLDHVSKTFPSYFVSFCSSICHFIVNQFQLPSFCPPVTLNVPLNFLSASASELPFVPIARPGSEPFFYLLLCYLRSTNVTKDGSRWDHVQGQQQQKETTKGGITPPIVLKSSLNSVLRQEKLKGCNKILFWVPKYSQLKSRCKKRRWRTSVSPEITLIPIN